MAKLNENENLDLDLDALGLGDGNLPEGNQDDTNTGATSDDSKGVDANEGVGEKPAGDIDLIKESKRKADEALKNAAATAAIKAAVEANNEIAIKEAEKAYIIEKKKAFLNRCKSDKVKKFVGNKLFAQYFGTTYTFLYNTIPVTVKFDGTEQELPEFVYNRLMEKINEVAESNTNKIIIDDRTK